MLNIFVTFVLWCSISSLRADTPFKDCGSELGTIQAFQVTDCTKGPCKFIKGRTYSMNLTFTAKVASKTANVALHGVIAGVPIPFPLNDSNACELNVKCPIAQGDSNTATFSLPVLSTYPSISLYVKLEIIANDAKQDYVCLLFPATITSGAIQRNNLVNWKKGKLFETLDK